MRLSKECSMQDHLKSMTEVCDELSAIDEPISEEVRVVYLLASLQESFNVLVTSLEASVTVPPLATVAERLLHQEAKVTKPGSQESLQEGALTTRVKKKLTCYYCYKVGHIKRNCEEYTKMRSQARITQEKKKTKMGAFKVTITAENGDSSDSESAGLVVEYALSAGARLDGQCILDSGATCQCATRSQSSSTYKLYPLP